MTTPFGGLADRLRGIVALFHVAKIFGLKLLISEESLLGGSGQDYILPSGVTGGPDDWRTPNADDILSKSPAAKRFSATPKRVTGYQQLNLSADSFDSFVNDPVVDVVTNSLWLRKLQENPRWQNHPEVKRMAEVDKAGQLWPTALKALFKPGPRITKLLQQVEKDFLRPGTYKVGLHVRSGDSKIGDPDHRAAHFSYRESYPCYAKQAVSEWTKLPKALKEKYPNGLVVFMTSDDPAAMSTMRETLQGHNFTNFFDAERYSSSVRHIDYSKGEDQTRTFLDWFLFTKMDLIIASPSGFSASAGRFHCTPSLINAVSHTPLSDCQWWGHFTKQGLCLPSSNFHQHLTK